MHILDQQAPGLTEKLAKLLVSQRRQLVAKVCELASRAMPDPGPEVRLLLETISRDNFLPAVRVTEVRSMAEAADNLYLAQREQGMDRQVWLKSFSQARLLTAVANEFGGSSWQDTADALYELFHTQDDPTALITLAEREAAVATGMV
jgi:hypothetical protein